MDDRYIVSIYVAAPGTPLRAGGTSMAGHVYYTVSDGKTSHSLGFAPEEHGARSGPGKVYTNDADQYQKPIYRRDMEISKEQYDKLLAFGNAPAKHGFEMNYNGASNSCIDFTWGALNHAGLHRHNILGMERKGFEGNLKPLDNVDAIRSIRAPFPDSELNREVRNPMPERTLMQRLISEQHLPQKDRELLESIRSKVAEVDQQHGRAYDDASERISASLLALAKEKGIERVDYVALSQATADAGAGQRIFLIEGDPANPAHTRASMETATAAQAPVEQSFAKVGQLEQDQKAQALAVGQEPQLAVQEQSMMRMS
ncbi:TPA: XVIPCD domain-containing protein [Stenotrophomonas maltophilia]